MRLFVTGPTASGKSTLAAKVARRVALPLHSLDDIHWVRHPAGDWRREQTERVAMLERVTRGDEWVIEGVQFKWAQAAIDRATLIIVLDLPRWRNVARIMRRFAGRQVFEPGPRATPAALAEEWRWSADYFRAERGLLFETLASRRHKVVIARSRVDEEAAFRTAVAAVARETEGVPATAGDAHLPGPSLRPRG